MTQANTADSSLNIAEVYKEVRKVTDNRLKKDVLYRILFGNDELSITAAKKIRDFLVESYPKMSPRLRTMLDYASSSDLKVANHALILFALATEDSAGDIISSLGVLPAEKFSYFREHALQASTHNLLDGMTTCMRSYVEDARSAYFTE